MTDRQIVTGEVRKLEKREERALGWFASGQPVGQPLGPGPNGGRAVRSPSPRSARPERVVYAFLVEQFDEQGNASPAVVVEMVSKSGFDGLLSEGDQVTFFADKRMPSGALKVRALRNLTTNTLFGERRALRRGDVPGL